MPAPDLDRRLRAVERALTGDDPVPDLADDAELVARVDDLAATLDDLTARVDELDAAVQAVRGYVGQVDHVNERVERRANAACAAVDRLESDGDGSRGTESLGGGGRIVGPESRGDASTDPAGVTDGGAETDRDGTARDPAARSPAIADACRDGGAANRGNGPDRPGDESRRPADESRRPADDVRTAFSSTPTDGHRSGSYESPAGSGSSSRPGAAGRVLDRLRALL